ncbi:hypothetical protein Taro_003709, partial [Colocasia esculenta]|nr:hypothetical protein [Colocasia esculenta]
ATNGNLPPNVIKRPVKELHNLDQAPPEGIKLLVNDDDFSTIFADIEGSAGTPYENGSCCTTWMTGDEDPVDL